MGGNTMTCSDQGLLLKNSDAIGFIQDTTIGRRLVACWNACDGLRTEELEQKVGIVASTLDGAVGLISLATEQRDALAAELDASQPGGLRHVSEFLDELPTARAAIASAEPASGGDTGGAA